MRIRDLHVLPKVRDGLGYLYLDRGRVEQDRKGIEFQDEQGRTLIPVASLACLMLGPGTSITHEAVKRVTDNGCSILWTGEEGVRCYAQGGGETRKAERLIHQARMVSAPDKRLQVVRAMYQYRFDEEIGPDLTIEQVRGKEGARVRAAYAEASRKFGVPWNGRWYHRGHWGAADNVNRALSAANSCLNGLCHAAIVSSGYSTGLGFIHTGKQLSFVYDIADLYKSQLTIPLAFQLTSESTERLESRVRAACRDLFPRSGYWRGSYQTSTGCLVFVSQMRQPMWTVTKIRLCRPISGRHPVIPCPGASCIFRSRTGRRVKAKRSVWSS